MNRAELRERLAELVSVATDGELPAQRVLADGASLTDLGVDSLGMVRLIDGIEAEYGVEVLPDDGEPLPDTVDGLADHVIRCATRDR